MQEQSSSPTQKPDSERVFRARPFLLHNTHVQNGRRYETNCGFCREGLGAVVEDVETPMATDGMAQNSGGDQEGSATSPLGDGWAVDEDGYLHRQR